MDLTRFSIGGVIQLLSMTMNSESVNMAVRWARKWLVPTKNFVR